MRVKRIVLLLMAVLLLAGAGFYMLVIRKDRAADPLDFLPGDTLTLIDLLQPATVYDKYRQSRLGQRMSAIHWGDLLRQFGASEEEAVSFQNEMDQLQAFLAGPVSRELFARRAVLALLPALPSANGGFSSPWDSLVLIAQPRHRPDVAELLTPLLAGDSQVAMETYQGRDIRTFLLADNATLAVVASDGLLLASFSVDTLKRCIDLVLRQPAAMDRLNSNLTYLSLRKRADGRDEQFVYGDVGAVTRLLSTIVNSGTGVVEPSTVPGEDGFGHGAFFCGTEMARLDCTAILQNAPGGTVAATPPAVDDTLAVAPADVLLHYWTNLLDLPRVAAELRHNPQFQDTVAGAEEWFVRKTGFSLPDFFALFGSQISLTVTGMRGNGFFPLPRLYGRVAIQDEERFRQALAALFAGKSQASREEAGVRIHTVLLAGGLLQPSWTIRDGFVFFADSPEQLAQSLVQPEAPLVESPRFKVLNVGLAAPNNMTAYVNYPPFLDGIQQLVAWTITILTMMDQERGGRAGALVNLVVTPVLEGMKMFAAGGSRLLLAPSELVMESTLFFADEAGGGK